MTQRTANIYTIIYLFFFLIVLGLLQIFVISENPSNTSLVIAIITALIAAVPFNLIYRKRDISRSKALIKTAGLMGWKYEKTPDLPFLKALARSLNIDSRIHPLNSFITESVSGRIDGMSFIICDGSYDYLHGGRDEEFFQTLFAISIKDADFPLFGVEPKTFARNFQTLLNSYDIEFQTHPKFSKSHILYGEDEDSIRQLFVSEVLTFFESREGFSTFGYKNHLVMYRKKKQFSPENFESELEPLLKLAEMFQRHEKSDNTLNKLEAKENTLNDSIEKKRVQYW